MNIKSNDVEELKKVHFFLINWQWHLQEVKQMSIFVDAIKWNEF